MQEGPGRGLCCVNVGKIDLLARCTECIFNPQVLPTSVHHMVVTLFKGTKNLEPHHY